MPRNHRMYGEWDEERFLSWARSIGPYAECVIAKVIEERDHPEQAFRVCLGILNLTKTYGRERLNNACRRAHSFQLYSYRRIRNMLKQGIEGEYQAELDIEEQAVPAHGNIRGQDYYR